MLAAIATLEQLAVPDSANLKQAAATIIAELTLLGEQTGERLERTQALKQKGFYWYRPPSRPIICCAQSWRCWTQSLLPS